MIFLLNIDNYAPKITSLTYPLIHRYANKIGAEVFIISERKFPVWPLDYEKLQIFELAKQLGADWNIYIDSDMAIHPDFLDLTAHLGKDTISHLDADVATVRWRMDDYFRRDGRFIGSGNCFTVASDWCLDLWRPLDDLNCEQAINRIFPIQAELKKPIKPGHLISDFTLSRNISRFGLKFMSVKEILKKLGLQNANWIWHHYLISEDEKADRLAQLLNAWGV